MKMFKTVAAILLFLTSLQAVQIKDIANVVGVRDNHLIGYGLVVGLNGTGDGSSSQFTRQAISSMLQSVHVKVDPRNIKAKNVAAVMVTAELPAFSRHGDKIDIVVASMGDAKSIIGGTLLMTPLRGVDGQIYALAQGKIAKGYSSDKRNVRKETVAKIFKGAIVEQEVDFDLYHKETIRLSLKRADFDTALKIQNRLNALYGAGTAVALDPRTIELHRPANRSMVEFLARVDRLDVDYRGANKIVIDEKTGTVVAGVDIRVDPIVITHGDLTLKIAPKSKLPGESDTYVDTKNNVVNLRYGEVTVANIARVLQKLGSKPEDIIDIIETIKQAGAINAELEVI
jgi:flagellar P-ring protein precursor FlgI